MKKRPADFIADLDGMSRTELLVRWRDLYGKSAPMGMRRELMIPFLAYRLQENLEGGLSASAKLMLKAAQRQIGRAPRPGSRYAHPPAKVGTRIIRRWKAVVHEVEATETGYQYCGHGYRSLSEIARKITGTRWSGPAFFGLKRRKH
jgi:Protein of unknown function (DUF2924)